MGKMISIGNIPVYEVQPKGKCKGGLLVIHEVWGLTDHIKDVAERFAREGYLVYAPNLLSNTDIEKLATPQLQKDLFDPRKRNEVQPKLRQIMAPLQSPEFARITIDKIQVCFNFLHDESQTQQKVAIVGYCFGGSYCFNLAANEPRLQAAVVYYGHADLSNDQLSRMRCPVLAFYGEKDERLISQLPELKDNMSAAGVDFSAKVYADAGHAFFNDTNPFAYQSEAAKDAWLQTLDFLSKKV